MTNNTNRPTVGIQNAETGEIVIREMNDEEFAQYEKDQASRAIADAALAQREADRTALLAQLGITEEQAKLLIN